MKSKYYINVKLILFGNDQAVWRKPQQANVIKLTRLTKDALQF
jgi:hypothetical protein